MWDFLDNQLIILASASSRRNELLKMAGLTFIKKPVETDETLNGYLTIYDAVMDIAERKAAAAAEDAGESGWVIGADTIVICDDEILGKPVDVRDARSMLSKLSGKTHRVITGFSILRLSDRRIKNGFEETRVTFYPLSESDIERYIDSGEPFDKAGGYGAQGLGNFLIERIDGCFFNVVGLPLSKLRRTWKQFFEE